MQKHVHSETQRKIQKIYRDRNINTKKKGTDKGTWTEQKQSVRQIHIVAKIDNRLMFP